jgi:inositol hexakisphosphate/diphosphoinositol-pentakisphosphate kinase
VEGFRQTVCGFDILRVKKENKSYVCDVNGFSFVKNSKKYYDDASQVLVELLLTRLRPKHYSVPSTRAPLIRNSMKGPSRSGSGSNSNESSRSPSPLVEVDKDDRTPNSSTSERSQRASSREGGGSGDKSGDEQPEELRCVIAVIRHGDRTPKQKMKIKCSIPKYLDYFHRYIYKYNNNTNKPEKDLKVKQRSCLIEFLETTREIISENSVKNTLDENLFRKLKQMRDVLERWEISGINRKLQMKPQMWERDENGKAIRATEVLLILKWGGDLTPLGMEQAESLGRQFRHQMYPDHSGGVLRLHSTYRHDLKIKASDEGRVMKTAAAFAKGLLELEGQLTPIIVSLVDWEEKNRQLLDRNGNFAVAEDIERSKVSRLN